MDTETSQKWSKRKGAKTSHPKVPKPLASHMFSFSIIQGRGGRRWRSIAAISIYPLWFCENPEILSNRKGCYYCFGMVSVKPKGGAWNWQPGQGGAVLYRAPKMSPGTSLNLGQIALHMLLLKGFLQEAKKPSGASAISVGNVVLESLCTIYLQDFQMLPAKGLPETLSWEWFGML